jgi:hypothetical protein
MDKLIKGAIYPCLMTNSDNELSKWINIIDNITNLENFPHDNTTLYKIINVLIIKLSFDNEPTATKFLGIVAYLKSMQCNNLSVLVYLFQSFFYTEIKKNKFNIYNLYEANTLIFETASKTLSFIKLHYRFLNSDYGENFHSIFNEDINIFMKCILTENSNLDVQPDLDNLRLMLIALRNISKGYEYNINCILARKNLDATLLTGAVLGYLLNPDFLEFMEHKEICSKIFQLNK